MIDASTIIRNKAVRFVSSHVQGKALVNGKYQCGLMLHQEAENVWGKFSCRIQDAIIRKFISSWSHVCCSVVWPASLSWLQTMPEGQIIPCRLQNLLNKYDGKITGGCGVGWNDVKCQRNSSATRIVNGSTMATETVSPVKSSSLTRSLKTRYCNVFAQR